MPDPGGYGLFQQGLPADVPPFQPRGYPQFLGPTGLLPQLERVEGSSLFPQARWTRFATGGYITPPSSDPGEDRIPAFLSEGGRLQFWRGDHSGNHPDDMFRIQSPRGMLPAGAEFPQVASENPQVTHTGQAGGWRGWFHRMRRTR